MHMYSMHVQYFCAFFMDEALLSESIGSTEASPFP